MKHTGVSPTQIRREPLRRTQRRRKIVPPDISARNKIHTTENQTSALAFAYSRQTRGPPRWLLAWHASRSAPRVTVRSWWQLPPPVPSRSPVPPPASRAERTVLGSAPRPCLSLGLSLSPGFLLLCTPTPNHRLLSYLPCH